MIGGLLRTTSLAAIAAATVAFSGASAPAKAADLGGNCCADLEERVAELEATTVRKGNRKMSVTLSGFVGHNIMWWDDGQRSDVYIGDGGNLGSRFRFVGSAKISPTLSAGFLYEFGVQVNALGSMNQDFGGDDFGGSTAPLLRDQTVWLQHTQLGKVKLGHGSTATDNLILIDLSGAAAAMTADVTVWQNAFRPTTGPNTFLDQSATGSACWGSLLGGSSPTAFGTPCSGISFDTSRRNHIMYETPTIAGFNLQAAFAEDNFWDIALRYAGEHHGFRVAFGIGYYMDTDFSSGPGVVVVNVEDERVMGSASIMHVATGLWMTGAFGHREIDREGVTGIPDADYWYIAGGLTRNFTGFGNTVFFVEYSNSNDFLAQTGYSSTTGLTYTPTTTRSDVDMWGIGVVQHLDAAASELFLTYKNFSADATLNGVDQSIGDFQTVIGGMRVNF